MLPGRGSYRLFRFAAWNSGGVVVSRVAMNRNSCPRNSPAHPPAGRRIRAAFKDGEVLVGTTTGYQSNRPGFFIVPADAGSNNERCYVVSAATKEIDFL